MEYGCGGRRRGDREEQERSGEERMRWEKEEEDGVEREERGE